MHSSNLRVVRTDKPDPIELLRRAGYRPTFRDRVEDFIFDVRLHPQLAILCAAGGMLAGLLVVIVPCLVIVAVTR